MKKVSIISTISILSIATSAFGAALVVNFDSGGFDLQGRTGVSLSGGVGTVAHDGFIVELGYFSGATSNDNNFVGQFIPLTGQGSANFATGPAFATTIGDDPADLLPGTNGQFSLHVTFDTTVQTALPAPGTILSIRVFDKALITDPTINFATFSSNLWKWKTPGSLTDPNSTISISLADGGPLDVRKENRLAGAGTQSTANGSALSASTTRADIPLVPTPEPTSMVLLSMAGMLAFARSRSRK